MNVIEIEHGSVILASENDTSLMTIITLTFSTIGIALSGAAIVLLLLTAYLFVEWRQNYKNQLLIQFMISRFLYTVVRYLYDINNVFSLCVNDGCVIYLDVLAMVYTEMLLISWMFIFSRNMYESFVNILVADPSNIWRVSIPAWIVPGCASLLLHLLFKLQKNHDFLMFFVYLILFKWPVLIANAVTLSLVLKSILKINLSKTENNKRIILVMIALIFMFCFQQLLLDTIKIVHALFVTQYTISSYILILSNIFLFYHCALSIIFWVFGNEKTRKLWKSCCQRKLNIDTIKLNRIEVNDEMNT